jgi:predicted ATPase
VLTYLSLDLFCLGYLDRACARSEEAIEEAHQLQHSYSIAHSLSQACWVDWAAHSREELKRRTGAAIAVSAEHCFPYNLAVGTIFGAWAMAASGQTTEGIALLREGLAAYHATGAMLFVPFFLTLLTDAQVKGQHPDEALGHLAEAERLLAQTDERWVEAELYRVRGELLCADGDTITAEGCFRKAISIARQQRAKFWELRAATSFARLRRDQARRAEAHDLLARSTAGSPKASTRLISEPRRCCSTNWPEAARQHEKLTATFCIFSISVWRFHGFSHICVSSGSLAQKRVG